MNDEEAKARVNTMLGALDDLDPKDAHDVVCNALAVVICTDIKEMGGKLDDALALVVAMSRDVANCIIANFDSFDGGPSAEAAIQ